MKLNSRSIVSILHATRNFSYALLLETNLRLFKSASFCSSHFLFIQYDCLSLTCLLYYCFPPTPSLYTGFHYSLPSPLSTGIFAIPGCIYWPSYLEGMLWQFPRYIALFLTLPSSLCSHPCNLWKYPGTSLTSLSCSLLHVFRSLSFLPLLFPLAK